MPICKVTLKAKKRLSGTYHNTLNSIGNHIRKRRLEQNLFQADVAHIIGVEKTSIYNWENNRGNPTVKLILRIIDFLDYVHDVFSNETIGTKIIAYRKFHGLSQKKFAEILSIDQSTLKRWGKNIRKPSKKYFTRLITILSEAVILD